MKDKLFKYLALKALLTITLSTLLAAWTFGQNKVVGELHFEGLKRNKQSYLLQQIKTQPGQPVDSLQLDKDIQNLNMLPSVANALYTLTDSADLTHVTFTVEEAITSLPIFNVGLIDENIWFRVGYSSLNFGGVGHQLNASYQYNDRRNNFFLYYKAPVWGQSKWGNSLSLSRYSSLEPLFFEEGAVDYEYEIRNLNVSTSYSFTPNNILELSVGYFIEQYEQSSIQDIVPTPGPVERTEYKSLIKLSHQFRKLKFDYFRINGFQNTAALQEVITFFSENKFLSLSTQFVAHKFVGKTGNLSTRLWFGIASNSNSPFAPFVLDSYVNIRGAGNRVDRGTAQLTLNAEYRQTLFNKNKFAAQAVIFSDQGNWRNPGGELDELLQGDNYRHLAGGGLRLIYRKGYNYILRADYGFSVTGTEPGGFVLGIGQYF